MTGGSLGAIKSSQMVHSDFLNNVQKLKNIGKFMRLFC
jgi:hypothetical protein